MEKVQANRNFANKLWNTARYIVMGIEKLSETERQALAVSGPMDAAELASMPLPERWVISRCHSLVERVTRQLSAYDFGPAGQSIYAFLWDEYADWYLEISKRCIAGGDPAAAAQARRTLVYVLDACLRLLHPKRGLESSEEPFQDVTQSAASLLEEWRHVNHAFLYREVDGVLFIWHTREEVVLGRPGNDAQRKVLAVQDVPEPVVQTLPPSVELRRRRLT